MNALTIERLSKHYDPLVCSSTVVDQGLVTLDDEDLRFINAYRNPKFAWDITSRLVAHNKDIPYALGGDDDWTYRAYLHKLNPTKYKSKAIAWAASFEHPSMKRDRDVLRALLISKDATPKIIATRLNIPLDVVTAYEKLFFNVIDRKADTLFIRQIVYPNTRYEELMDDYMQHEDLGNLLMRAGYNNGLDDVLYFAGMSDMSFKVACGKDAPSKLESAFMAHAYLLVRNGYVNQNMTAVSSARSLIAAAKQGGDSGAVASPFHGQVGKTLYADFMHHFNRTYEIPNATV